MDLVDTLQTRKTAMTAQEVADLLNVSRRLVYQHAKQGRIPSFKVGDARRFDPKLVADWLRKK